MTTMTSITLDPILIDRGEALSASISSSSELDNTTLESNDSDESLIHSSLSKKHKRELKAVNIWLHGRKYCLGKPERDEKNRLIWYYKYCSWNNFITTNIRKYMKDKHGLDIAESESLVKKAGQQSLRVTLARQGKLAVEKNEEKKEQVLQGVIDKEIVRGCFAQLIVMRNLPHNAVKWPELRTLLLSVNRCCEDVLIDS
ncbi:hypothetical protein F5884DRAFT_129293 [Xylogone sp. PMI_703]|nr:hypothetical protein F5884DRAFT_138403 [Xylogone sp. PMI_703]KAH8799480.1 hypothetical protein F5884DRAFT_129293 [Xylogone sp. PMI_703]